MKPDLRRFLTTIAGLSGPSWASWVAIICGAFGLALNAAEAAIFRQLTRRDPLKRPCRELWLAVGRRGGKNRVTAAVVVFLALVKRWPLSIGEIGTVLVLAGDRQQAKVAYRYILGLLRSVPLLAAEIANVTADTITLRNGIEIAIVTADNAAVRGRTVVAAVADEFAFWGYEDAAAVLTALRPSMATQPESLLMVLSTVYAASGPFYEARRAHFGVADHRVLYAVGTTRQMNPTIDQDFIDAEIARDSGNRAEYLSEERTDREALFDTALLDQATRSGPRDLPHREHLASGTPIIGYMGVDVSGGKVDAAAAARASRDGRRVIIDAVRRWPSPHDPVAVAAEVAAFAKSYGHGRAIADQYGAEVVRAVYRDAGLTLSDAPVNRSEAYLHLLPLFTSGRIEIPDDPILRRELLGLERRVGRNGRDSVDHRPGSHDDLANAVALAAYAATRRDGREICAADFLIQPLSWPDGYCNGGPAGLSVDY